ncbi:hypothetical protein HDR61_04495 [bacterium]|nr:hypothetical protein [bacterium]
MISFSSRGDIVLNEHAKEMLFKIDCKRGATAIDSKNKVYPLSDLDIDCVKYIAGAWRVQNKFEHKIQIVRGQEFVLLEKINRTEKNRFEFYRAAIVGKNSFGRFLIDKAQRVVAKYETDNRTYWSYGDSIEQARAFMGIRLYDEYSDLIDAIACKNKQQTR